MVEYTRTLGLADFNATVDTNCVAGVWTRLGAYTIPAGMKVAIGRRFDGYASAVFKETTAQAELHGKVRIVATDPQEFRKVVVLEFNTRTCTDPADKTKKVLIPLRFPWVRTDSKLILEFDPAATEDFDASASALYVDSTVQV